MFYWDKNDSGYDLKNQLHTISDINEIFIATAFISIEGVRILQNLIAGHQINKDKITICLSAEFSDIRPSEILVELDKIANVRIAKSGRLFHPKFYYIKGEKDNLMICGSSNLTDGGFGKNIEFDSVYAPSLDEIDEIKKFIRYCFSQTEKLTVAHINFYKSQEDKLVELNKIKRQIAQQLKSFEERDDPFSEGTYDIADFYFNFTDYEVLFSRNSNQYTAKVQAQRKLVKEKLLRINEIVEEQVRDLNLYVHWNKNKITSLDYPSIYNKNIVNWMGIRYGKRKEEVCFGGGYKDQYESFTKHACLQYVLYPEGFEIDLFFAVPDNAFDRQYLKENINKFADKINMQVQAMKGHGLEWRISDCKSFNFDAEDDLVTYLKQNDRDGRFSSLNLHFAPNDPRIKTLQGICKEIVDGFNLLKPLYDLIVWRGKRS